VKDAGAETLTVEKY